MGLRRLLTVMGLGAGLMYLYDPDEGNRRRALLRDQLNRFQNDSLDFIARARQDLRNRRQGMKAEPITGGLGGLSGDWTPGVRLVAALAGGGMTFYGLAKSGISGAGATFLGLNLVSRSIFNRSMADAAQGVQGQFEQTKSAAEKRSSNGKKQGYQEEFSAAGATGQSSRTPGADASPASEQGASRRRYQGRESSSGMTEGSSTEREPGDESGGFDSMLPGNPSEGNGQ